MLPGEIPLETSTNPVHARVGIIDRLSIGDEGSAMAAKASRDIGTVAASEGSGQ